jgi:hypothetical protein
VRWYLRFGLSYRDVEELLAERGIEVDHVTIYRWVQRFAPEFAAAARARQQAGELSEPGFVTPKHVELEGFSLLDHLDLPQLAVATGLRSRPGGGVLVGRFAATRPPALGRGQEAHSSLVAHHHPHLSVGAEMWATVALRLELAATGILIALIIAFIGARIDQLILRSRGVSPLLLS